MLLIDVQSYIEMMRGNLRVDDGSVTFNTNLAEAQNAARASVSLRSAIDRTESRDAHAREDFPKRDDEKWLKHTFAWPGDNGDIRLGCRPVQLQPLTNEVASVPPKECDYLLRASVPIHTQMIGFGRKWSQLVD